MKKNKKKRGQNEAQISEESKTNETSPSTDVLPRAKKMPVLVKIFLILLILGGITAGVLIGLRKYIASSKTTNTTYTVTKEVYENVIEISGVVASAQSQTLQALSDGTVVGVYVEQGDVVKKGDIIIQLDDSTEQYNLAKHDFETETVRITGSWREYQLKLTQRNALVQKIAERKVTATFDGIIAAIDVAVGASLAAKDNVGTLVDNSYLTAEVEVAETDVGKLKVGQEVDFKFSASDQTVKGYVVGWPALGTVTSRGATVVKVKVRIDEYPEEILPNFSFSGKIKISPDEEYLIVSRYAIGRENGQAYVELASSGEKINVTVQPYDREYVKVTEGLSGGEVLKGLSTASASGMQRRNVSGGNRQGAPSGGFPSGGFGAPPRMGR